MRKMLAVVGVAAVLGVAALALAGGGGPITVLKLIDDVGVGTNTTVAVDLGGYNPDGRYSIELEVWGTGVVTELKYQVANWTNFLSPSSSSAIASNVTTTSGPGSDGRDLYEFDPEPARYLRFYYAVTGAAPRVSAWVAIQ